MQIVHPPFGKIMIAALASVLIFFTFAVFKTQKIKTFADGNVSPTVDSVNFSYTDNGSIITSFDMAEGATQPIVIYGEYSDANDCTDVESNIGNPGVQFEAITLMFHRSGVACSDPSHFDESRCYGGSGSGPNPSTCVLSNCGGPGDLTGHYACTFNIPFFADATDSGEYSDQNWVAEVIATDLSNASYTATSGLEMNTLNALNLDSALIDYGALDFGATSTEKLLRVLNSGNKNGQNFEVASQDLLCSSAGAIPAGQQKFSTSTGIAYESKEYAAANASSTIGTALGKSTTTSVEFAASTTLYWQMVMPSSGVLGSCTGTITIVGN